MHASLDLIDCVSLDCGSSLESFTIRVELLPHRLSACARRGSLTINDPQHACELLLTTRYLNTGVVFVRVRHDAVSQLEKWVAIMNSGVIKCHPWDQAGLQWMFAHALDPNFPLTTLCTPPRCGGSPGGKFYSCTPIFEQVVESRYGVTLCRPISSNHHSSWQQRVDTVTSIPPA